MKNNKTLPITLLISFISSKEVFAANSDVSLTSASLRMFWGLLVVMAVLLAIYGLMKKRLSPVYTNAKSKIKVLEIRHLMPKKSICLVEVSGREYLLGLGSDTVTLLSSTGDEETDKSINDMTTSSKDHE